VRVRAIVIRLAFTAVTVQSSVGGADGAITCGMSADIGALMERHPQRPSRKGRMAPAMSGVRRLLAGCARSC